MPVMKTGNTRGETKTIRVVRSDGAQPATATAGNRPAPQPRTFLVHTLRLRSSKAKR